VGISSWLTTSRKRWVGTLVMDLRITNERFGSSSDPSRNGQLHYPNDVDRSLNEDVTDKIRKYHTDYNNNPLDDISFRPGIGSTSGRLHSEFVSLLFLQTHRETERFFSDSGVHLPKSTSGLFHFHRVVFSSQLKSKVVNTLTKVEALRINLNLDGVTITYKSHTYDQPSVCETCRSLNFSF